MSIVANGVTNINVDILASDNSCAASASWLPTTTGKAGTVISTTRRSDQLSAT